MDGTEPVALRVEDQPDGQDLQIASADPGNLKNRFSFYRTVVIASALEPGAYIAWVQTRTCPAFNLLTNY